MLIVLIIHKETLISHSASLSSRCLTVSVRSPLEIDETSPPPPPKHTHSRLKRIRCSYPFSRKIGTFFHGRCEFAKSRRRNQFSGAGPHDFERRVRLCLYLFSFVCSACLPVMTDVLSLIQLFFLKDHWQFIVQPKRQASDACHSGRARKLWNNLSFDGRLMMQS